MGISPPSLLTLSGYMNSPPCFLQNWVGWGGGGCTGEEEEDQSSERRDVLKHKQAWLRERPSLPALARCLESRRPGIRQAAHMDVKSRSTAVLVSVDPDHPGFG